MLQTLIVYETPRACRGNYIEQKEYIEQWRAIFGQLKVHKATGFRVTFICFVKAKEYITIPSIAMTEHIPYSAGGFYQFLGLLQQLKEPLLDELLCNIRLIFWMS